MSLKKYVIHKICDDNDCLSSLSSAAERFGLVVYSDTDRGKVLHNYLINPNDNNSFNNGSSTKFIYYFSGPKYHELCKFLSYYFPIYIQLSHVVSFQVYLQILSISTYFFPGKQQCWEPRKRWVSAVEIHITNISKVKKW